jgi:tRNA nucleotidyltransferase/poly(A) polymerase
MRHILVAPGAVGAVEALFDYGLLTNVLGGVPRLVRFERLVSIETANGLVPSAALRLAALAVFVEEDVARLADRLRPSNAEQAVLALGALGVDGALPGEEAAKALLYRLGPDAYRSRLLLAWADADARPEDGEWRKALALPERWQVPAFPIGGNDVMALGELKGPGIGALLKRLEQDWIESGFALDRDQLLAEASALISRRT